MPSWDEGAPLKAGDMVLGVYQPSPETKGFWDGVAIKELRLKKCACGAWHHPRRIMCTVCRSTELAWAPSQGKGELYTFSEVHRAAGAFAEEAPFFVGIVRLLEGVHLFSRIIAHDRDDVRIGAALDVDFRTLGGGQLLPVFAVGGGAR